MRLPGFNGPSYAQQSQKADVQRCVNLYLERHELGGGKHKEQYSMPQRPGLGNKFTLGAGPIRGMRDVASVGRRFIVSGNTLYERTSSASINRGTLNTSLGRVGMADNGVQLLIVDGQDGWVFTFATNALARITDPDFPIASHCDFQDGYFAVNEVGTRNWYISTLYEGATWDALDFGAKEGWPDNLLALKSNHREMVLLGSRSCELWANTGDADFPFTRIDGAFIEVGLLAEHSLQVLDNTPIFLAQDKDGFATVMRIVGYQAQRISTHALEQKIQGYSAQVLSAATSFTFQIGGHAFYVLNFQEMSWVFDASNGQWAEWSYWNDGVEERFRGDCHMVSGGKHLVGDYQNGNVYELSHVYLDDDGAPIRRMRRFRLPANGLDEICMTMFGLDVEVGMAAAGTEPKALIRWSDDGGMRWSNERQLSLGKTGEFKKRVVTHRLGSYRDRVMEVVIADAVKSTMVGAFAEYA